MTPIATSLNLPSSVELIGDTAYVVALTGEIWTVDTGSGPSHGHH
jgi:hypothetical protein